MKETKIICRVTNSQKETLEKEARNKNVSLSEIIRLKLNSNNGSNLNDTRKNFRNMCFVLTEIQKMKLEYPQVNFESIEERIEEAWHALM